MIHRRHFLGELQLSALALIAAAKVALAVPEAEAAELDWAHVAAPDLRRDHCPLPLEGGEVNSHCRQNPPEKWVVDPLGQMVAQSAA